jgi:hypothetical protein
MLRVDSNIQAIAANDKYVMDILTGRDGVAPYVLSNIVKTTSSTREMCNIQFALTKALLAQNAELRAEMTEKTKIEAVVRAENDRLKTLTSVLQSELMYMRESRVADAATEATLRAELYQARCEIGHLLAAALASAPASSPTLDYALGDKFLAAFDNIVCSCSDDETDCDIDSDAAVYAFAPSTSGSPVCSPIAADASLESILAALAPYAPQIQT